MDIHFPDLLAIRSVPNQETRLYALSGAAISLAAAGEMSLFELYRSASAEDGKTAAVAFYRYTRFQHKRDLAEGAVRKFMVGRDGLREWDNMVNDVQRLLGDSARNLVGHNPVQSTVELLLTKDGSFADIATRVFVEQNPIQVELSMRCPSTADEEILFTYCHHTITLCIRLRRLVERIRGILEQRNCSPPRLWRSPSGGSQNCA